MKRWTRILCGIGFGFALCLGSGAQGAFAKNDPRQVVMAFSTLNADGKILDLGGWLQMKKFVSQPVEPKRTPIMVIKDYVVSPENVTGNDADLFVEYSVIGQIDGDLLFKPLNSDSSPIKFRVEFHLTRGRSQGGDDPEWKINQQSVAPYVGLTSSIQYVEKQAKVGPTVKYRANAGKTIAILRRWSGFVVHAGR